MKLMGESRKNPDRRFVLLAPPGARSRVGRAVGQVVADASLHQRYLAGAQRLRGTIYLEDGAIAGSDVTWDGRHIQPADERSWHLLTVDERGRVTACLRYCAHQPGVAFSDLAVSRSTIASSPALSDVVREGIQAELECAYRRGFSFVELGGWAITSNLRGTTQAINTLITVYALSKLLGGAHGLSTATTRHHSSTILKRIGGAPLRARGTEIPPYYDPHYGCEMELLRFDSTCPNPRYAPWIDECCSALLSIPVISADHTDSCAGDLLNLHGALTDNRAMQPETANTGHLILTPA